MTKDGEIRGQPIAMDPKAISTSPTNPPFVAPPPESPAYYGFQVLNDVTIDGFTLGKIPDFEAEHCDYGDAFVIAPDDSRAGLVWEVVETRYFKQVLTPEPSRWGVWAVSFQHDMRNHEDAMRNLKAILPELREKWIEWCNAK